MTLEGVTFDKANGRYYTAIQKFRFTNNTYPLVYYDHALNHNTYFWLPRPSEELEFTGTLKDATRTLFSALSISLNFFRTIGSDCSAHRNMANHLPGRTSIKVPADYPPDLDWKGQPPKEEYNYVLVDVQPDQKTKFTLNRFRPWSAEPFGTEALFT